MSNPVVRTPRRFFLRGLGGATLALPMLPSLLTPDEARAQAAQNRRCFVQFISIHGGVTFANMYPPDAALTGSTMYSTAGHAIRSGQLAPAVQNGVTSLSPVLSAPSTRLTPALVKKMNLLRGLDITYPIAHHYGGATMGNLANNSSGGGVGALMHDHRRASIDQVMAWSPEFYQSLAGVRMRSIVLAGLGPISFDYSNPQTRTGTIQSGGNYSGADSLGVFNNLFPVQTTPTAPTGPARVPVVDRVLENYKRLRNGNGRLSSADRQRLDDHMQRIAELQRSLATTVSCQPTTRPTMNNRSLRTSDYDGNPPKQVQYFQMLNDVIALAIQCGVCRVAAVLCDSQINTFTTVPAGVWHTDVAHQVTTPTGQATMVESQRRVFADVVLDLAAKLDAMSLGDGTTALDKTLLCWAQEHSSVAHDTNSMPVVTLGSADHSINTGMYCDYRNLDKLIMRSVNGDVRPGLTWHQWLGTCLQTMGVPRKEWQEPDHNGYGQRVATTNNNQNVIPTVSPEWPESVWTAAGDVLPFLRKG